MRRSYTIGQKNKIIQYAEKNGVQAAAAYFKVLARSIYQWIPMKNELSKCNRRARSRNKRGAKWAGLEEELHAWIIDQRQTGAQVDTCLIRNRAKTIAVNKGIVNFGGTKCWCHSFMRRNNLSVRARTSIGQPLPEDHEKKKDDFIGFVENETIDVDLNDLGNMDEVPVPFEITSNKTVEQKGKDDVFISTTGHHRSFFTVVLTVTATGEKLKPLIIFKRKTMPKVKFPEGVVVRVNKKGWFKNDVMKDWSEEVWQKRRNCHSDPSKSLIIMDSARSHTHEDSHKELKKASKVAIIPGGMTKFLQPLDISVNKPFKDNLKIHWARWMADTTNAHYTKGGRRKRPGYDIVAKWIQESFEAVKTDSITNGFRKALTPNDEYRMEILIKGMTNLAIGEDDEEAVSENKTEDLNTTLDSLNLDELNIFC